MSKNIGLGIEKPEKECNDILCPWHGNLKVRGRVFNGKVVSAPGKKTAIVKWEYYNFIPKYERYERKNTKISVHNPECISAHIGDNVIIAECRKISKTKSFVIVGKKGEKK